MGVMKKKMETTIVYRDYAGIMEKSGNYYIYWVAVKEHKLADYSVGIWKIIWLPDLSSLAATQSCSLGDFRSFSTHYQKDLGSLNPQS